MKRIVVLGCESAGLETALRLKKQAKEAEITVITEEQFFTERSFLARGFREKDLNLNLKFLFSEKGINFVVSKVKGVDLSKKKVEIEKGTENFDILVIAPETRDASPDNTLAYSEAEDIEKIKSAVRNDLNDKKAEHTIVVCGGGAAGVELTCQLNEFLDSCCKETGVRRIDVKLVLFEKESSILPGWPVKVRRKVTEYLRRQGVEVRTNSTVTEVKKNKVILKNSELAAGPVVWCGERKVKKWLKGTDIETEDHQVLVNPYLQSVTDATIYGLGPNAVIRKADLPEKSVLGNIISQASLVAHNIGTFFNDEQKEAFEFRKARRWLNLGFGRSLLVWGDFVFMGKVVDFFRKRRESHYLKRWK